jgi:hypothetical protein
MSFCKDVVLQRARFENLLATPRRQALPGRLPMRTRRQSRQCVSSAVSRAAAMRDIVTTTAHCFIASLNCIFRSRKATKMSYPAGHGSGRVREKTLDVIVERLSRPGAAGIRGNRTEASPGRHGALVVIYTISAVIPRMLDPFSGHLPARADRSLGFSQLPL